MGKNGKKIYNFNNLAEFGDNDAKDMADDQLISTSHVVPKGGDFMQYVTHEDVYGNNFGYGFGDSYSIMIMLQNMQVRQDER